MCQTLHKARGEGGRGRLRKPIIKAQCNKYSEEVSGARMPCEQRKMRTGIELPGFVAGNTFKREKYGRRLLSCGRKQWPERKTEKDILTLSHRDPSVHTHSGTKTSRTRIRNCIRGWGMIRLRCACPKDRKRQHVNATSTCFNNNIFLQSQICICYITWCIY